MSENVSCCLKSVLDYEDSSCSSADLDGTGQDLLAFSARITDELRSHFRRNAGTDDYFDNIYDDSFSAPESGSYSYYSDLLAVADLKEPSVEDDQGQAQIHDKTDGDKHRSFYCSCQCSGRRSPSVGTGPLEELFQVLLPTPSPSHSSEVRNDIAPDWTHYMSTDDNNYSIDDSYSDFIDVFHRLTNDSFTLPTSMSSTDLRSFDEF
ncbi:uncharacterized protein LOC129234586 isoform X2 [Uloborus diversus]|uniref:uncharacterized protein LOC129234586 isoform X2 n=1 Tax=Uloborus diversus TaxID=327109 RepID=UPI002409DD75|nr:uncharacterized protein LOC129234586 isoform X2 [Uloborus diversus]